MCRPPVLKWLVLHTLLMPILAMRVRVHRNPVTRVTDLLERLKDKVEKQGADEAKLWEKMQCNCKKTTTNLQKNIEQEETRLPMLRSDHSALGAQKARLVAEKERAVADRTDAQTALSSAEELRQKEATDYTKLKEETQKNLAAIGKAIAAIEKGLSGSFLQTDEAEELRQVVSTANLRLSDRDALAALLAGEMPQSSSIVGVLQSMRDSMEEDQSSAESREAGAKSAFDGMATAKLNQISTLASEIEVKTSRIGELSVDMVNKQQAMDSSAKKLQDDSKLLADTKETCDQQEEDWQARSQSRADEMHAIQETLSLLGDEQAGDDDAIRALLVEALLCAADAQLAESFLAECEEKGRRAERDGALLEFVFADLDRRAFFQASVTLAAFFADQYSMHEGSDFKLKVVKGAHSVLVAFRSSDYAEAVKQTASALAKLCATGSMSSVAAAAIKDAGDFSPEAEELLVGVRQDAEVLKARPARPECDQALKDAAARARGEAPAISVKTQSALPRAATASAAEERRSQLGRSGRERKGTTVAGGKGGLYTGKGQGKAAAAPGKGDKNGTRVDPDVFKLPKSSAELQRDPEKAKTFQEDLRTFARNFKLSAELVGMDYIQLKPIGFVPHDTKQKAREELRMLLEFHFPSTSRPEPPRPLPTRQTHLRVHPEHGAGIELTVSEQGYLVDFVEDFPGQDLFVGDVILEINGQKLAGLSEAEMEDTFGAHFGDGAKLTIQPPER